MAVDGGSTFGAFVIIALGLAVIAVALIGRGGGEIPSQVPRPSLPRWRVEPEGGSGSRSITRVDWGSMSRVFHAPGVAKEPTSSVRVMGPAPFDWELMEADDEWVS